VLGRDALPVSLMNVQRQRLVVMAIRVDLAVDRRFGKAGPDHPQQEGPVRGDAVAMVERAGPLDQSAAEEATVDVGCGAQQPAKHVDLARPGFGGQGHRHDPIDGPSLVSAGSVGEHRDPARYHLARGIRRERLGNPS
jgi:hypothetical protein